MNAFHSGREAKEFLISRIVTEAQRENVSLSEVERKMLYFTESGWNLPDMAAVSKHFDSEYHQNEYEQKIARLIRNAAKHDRKESRDEYDTWWAAIRFLRREDHYISVMIGIAGFAASGRSIETFCNQSCFRSLLAGGCFSSGKISDRLTVARRRQFLHLDNWYLCGDRLSPSPIHRRQEKSR
jgi:hypothetical protein